MSEMIEQVAKAMWDVRRAHANKDGIFLEFWGDGTVPKANGIMEEARAAINAMREPTEVMQKAAREQTGQQSYADVWRAMIDEALKD
jgi:hypothetical protein